MRIGTDRLIIEEHTLENVPNLFGILSDPVTMSFWPQPFTYEQSLQWILERGLKHYKDGIGRYALKRKGTGELIGDAGILRLETDGVLENDLGYIISSKAWGTGLGYEAAEALMRYGFETLKLPRLCANMPADHTSSRKVAEKLGMKLEKQFLNRKNRGILTCLYALEKTK
jgi:RimJ/RimL family protein N-acetyltransferase